jgi:catechol 2,3-dioxygenase-like lactoylglutathione lyase family enzyme
MRRVSVVIGVSDLGRSVQFYRDKLGLHPIIQTSEWAEFLVGDARVALQAATDSGGAAGGTAVAGTVSVGFEVDDVVEAHEVLRAAEVRFKRAPAEHEFGALAVLEDPDHCPITLFEPR